MHSVYKLFTLSLNKDKCLEITQQRTTKPDAHLVLQPGQAFGHSSSAAVLFQSLCQGADPGEKPQLKCLYVFNITGSASKQHQVRAGITSGRCPGCVAPCSGSAPAAWTAGSCPSSEPPRTAAPPPWPAEAPPLREEPQGDRLVQNIRDTCLTHLPVLKWLRVLDSQSRATGFDLDVPKIPVSNLDSKSWSAP